jgi:23S rRNA (adenine2030-N6)-methyltransferase
VNYRHAFHAGNFADVFKHLVLLSLLHRFGTREKPFSYVETHAGKGLYDLQGAAARRTGEAGAGVLKLAQADSLPDEFRAYLQLVNSLPDNADGLRWYPGSPLIAQAMMREQDRAILVELHPEEAAELKRMLGRDRRFSVHCRDGWEALKGLLPPTPRRGLLLVDPPFEKPDEFSDIFNGLDEVQKRWANATVVVWYPIKRRADLDSAYRRLSGGTYGPVMRAEFCLHPDDTDGRLNGTGVFVIRPPWMLDQDIERWLPSLGPALTGQQAFRSQVDWLSAQV